jgi:hypothetical protein
MMQANRVRDAALIVLRRYDPYLLGESTGNPLQDCETRRLYTIVIGYKNSIQHVAASISSKELEPITRHVS